ncbi:MAG: CHAT domain-containing protein [Anaerolineales bacterium]|nr:CHAT domain-containing protein [Anaerolineales bacterium]
MTLAILAACETGRAETPRGDEILGLSRAMLYAGTPSLLATLWRVHELPTPADRTLNGIPIHTSAAG